MVRSLELMQGAGVPEIDDLNRVVYHMVPGLIPAVLVQDSNLRFPQRIVLSH